MSRQVAVFLYEKKIGMLRQDEQGFSFSYLEDYHGAPLSLSLPITERSFHSDTLFPYFKSLAPEGWLRKRFSQEQKIDEKDLLGFLIQNGKNLIGAVQLREEK